MLEKEELVMNEISKLPGWKHDYEQNTGLIREVNLKAKMTRTAQND